MSGGSNEAVFDPKIPAEQQKVTYQAKDGTIKTVTKAELQEQLETSEKLMQGLNETWEQKMERTQEVQKEREKALEELGISIDKNNVGVHTPKRVRYGIYDADLWLTYTTIQMPHLVNLVCFTLTCETDFSDANICILERRYVVGGSPPNGILTGLALDPLMSECLIYQLKLGKTMVRHARAQ